MKRILNTKSGYQLVEAKNLPRELFQDNGGYYDPTCVMMDRVYHINLERGFMSVNSKEFSQRVIKALDRAESMRA